VDDPTSTSSAPAADDPPAVASLRRLNDALGAAEEVACALGLAVLVAVSVWFAFATKVLHSTATWPYEVIRYFVFFVAIAGAALAAQRQGMFNMDLVTRRFDARTRSFLRIGGALLVATLCAVVVVSALDLRGASTDRTDHEVISEAQALIALVVGFALIGIHVVLHALIEVCYWTAGQAPPDPPHGGHG
jgi:TRAP-type C4-dicarboxylate transport system permease small subunit